MPLVAGPVADTPLPAPPPLSAVVVAAPLLVSVAVVPVVPADDEESAEVSRANKPCADETSDRETASDSKSASSEVSIRSCCQPSMNTADVSTPCAEPGASATGADSTSVADAPGPDDL